MSAPNRNAALGTAPIGKLMLKMAVPTVVAQIVNLLYSIVERIYIGQGNAHWSGDFCPSCKNFAESIVFYSEKWYPLTSWPDFPAIKEEHT